MQLSEFGFDRVREAIAIYLEHAYGDKTPRTDAWDLDYSVDGFDALFAQFLDEGKDEGGRKIARYALRLGNGRYPFMKFVVQEFLQAGDFYFVVDTHDEMKLDPAVPGYEEFCEIRGFNRKLKHQIESAWLDAELPTIRSLRRALTAAGRIVADDVRATVLVVDDDDELAEVMEAILLNHGFDVSIADDGKTALEALNERCFDLIICDYQMPGMDGAALCEALRVREDTCDTPVLLATAAPLSLADITDKANGFLVKPYREEVLMGLINGLLPPMESEAANEG